VNKQRFVDEQSRSNNQRYLNQRATFVKTIKTIKTNRSISVRCFPTRLSRDLSSALVYFVVMFMHDSLFGTRRSEPLPVSNEWSYESARRQSIILFGWKWRRARKRLDCDRLRCSLWSIQLLSCVHIVTHPIREPVRLFLQSEQTAKGRWPCSWLPRFLSTATGR